MKEVLQRIGTALAHLSFWGFNCFAVIIIGLGLFPFLLSEMFGVTSWGDVPWDFHLYSVGLLATPFVCTIVGFRKFRKSARQLAEYLFAVEVPIIATCVIRLFVTAEVNPALAFLFGTALCGAFGYHWVMLQERPKNRALQWSQTIILAFGAWATFWLLGFLSNYLLPVGMIYTEMLHDVFAVRNFSHLLERMFVMVIGMGLTGGAILIFIVTPLLTAFFQGIRIKHCVRSYGSWKVVPVLAVIGGICITAHIVLPKQNQQAVFAELRRWQQHNELPTMADKDLRAGLLNAYLSEYRYLDATDKQSHIYDIYEKHTTSSFANIADSYYKFWAKPFLYDGKSMHTDQYDAATYYQKYFDRDIQEAELDSIGHALFSTYMPSTQGSTLLDQFDQSVHLEMQSLKVTEHDMYTEIEWQETYRNQTQDEEEVLYYFNLPDDAVITGLWLSAPGGKEKTFPSAIAPRGAAQRVYAAQVAKRIDPALLEQVGPNSYRLRIFPIPVTWRGDNPEMTMWMRYQVWNVDREVQPTPLITESRNVYSDRSTDYFINDAIADKAVGWFPSIKPQVTLGNEPFAIGVDETKRIVAVPTANTPVQKLKLSVLIDTSKSMQPHQEQLHKLVQQLDGKAQFYWLDRQGGLKSKANAPERLTFADNKTWEEQIQIFSKATDIENGDGIVFLTDSFTQLKEVANELLSLPAQPLWLVYADQSFPKQLPDSLITKMLASNGGNAIELRSVLQALYAHKINHGNKDYLGQRSEHALFLRPGEPGDAAPSTFGNKVLIETKTTSELSIKDAHLRSQRHHILTPWSSMIVLVTEEQLKELADASDDENAFDRNQDNGNDVLNQPGGKFVSISGTPEPEEWLLLIMGALIVLYYYRPRWSTNGPRWYSYM